MLDNVVNAIAICVLLKAGKPTDCCVKFEDEQSWPYQIKMVNIGYLQNIFIYLFKLISKLCSFC